MRKKHLGTCHTVAMKDQGSRIMSVRTQEGNSPRTRSSEDPLAFLCCVEHSWIYLPSSHLALSNDKNN